MTAPKSALSREQLAAAVVAAQQHYNDLADQVASHRNDARLGYPGHAEQADRLTPDLLAAGRARDAAEDALAAFDATAARAAQEAGAKARAAADAARPRLIAVAAQRYRQSSRALQAAAEALRDALVEHVEAGCELGTAAGTADAARVMSTHPVLERARYGLFFVWRRNFDDKSLAKRGIQGVLDMLVPAGTVNGGHPWAKRTLIDIETETLDNVVPPLFVDRAEADATRRRRDPAGQTLHVVQREDGVWALVSGRRRMPPAEVA